MTLMKEVGQMKHMIAKRNDVAGWWLDPFLEDFFLVPSVFDRRAPSWAKASRTCPGLGGFLKKSR